MKSVTEMLRPLADARQQFTSIKEAWRQFLHYIEARKGVDINGTRKEIEVDLALNYVESTDDNFVAPRDSPRASWFCTFESREDVLEACRKFLRERGLPIQGC